MGHERRILLNALTLFGGEGVGQVVNLLFVVAFARHYGAAQLGDYSYAMGVGGVASLFVSLGLQGFLLRELATTGADPKPAMALLLPLQLGLVVAVGLAGCAFVVLTSHDGAALAVAVTVLTQIVFRFAGLLYVPFRARQRLLVPVGAEVAYRLVSLGLAFALMRAGAAAEVTLLATLGSAVAFALGGAMLFARENGGLSLRWDPLGLRALLRRARGFFGLLLISAFGVRFAPILMGLLATREALGNYAAADRLQIAATLLPTLLASATVAALARESSRSLAAVRQLTGRLLRIAVPGSLLIVTAAQLVAPLAVHAVFGERFDAAVPVLRVLLLAVPLVAVEQLLSAEITALGLVQRLVRVRAVVLCAYVALGFVGVRSAGGIGLAMAIVCTAGLQAAAIARVLHHAGALPLREVFSAEARLPMPDRAG